jgi:hypothetical protein
MSCALVSFAFWRDRLRASGLHLGICLIVAVLAATLVFFVWYPYPFREVSGGRELFLIVVTVDVFLGPMATLAVFNKGKGWSVLRRDLVVVGLLQLAALSYGLWVVSMSRPVHLVFEGDRFSVVHAIEIPAELLGKAPVGINTLPLTGPTLLALRPFKDNQERLDITLSALQGVPLAARPDLWQPFSQAIQRIQKAAKPVGELKSRFPARSNEIDEVLLHAGRVSESTTYLPLVGHKAFWTVFLDPVTAEVVAAMPLDSF